jgi:hypothetical protein
VVAPEQRLNKIGELAACHSQATGTHEIQLHFSVATCQRCSCWCCVGPTAFALQGKSFITEMHSQTLIYMLGMSLYRLCQYLFRSIFGDLFSPSLLPVFS